MKKILLLLCTCLFGFSESFAGNPPATAIVGAGSGTVTASATAPQGTVPLVLFIWVKNPAGAWTTVASGGGANGATVTASGSYTFTTAGTYVWYANYALGGTPPTPPGGTTVWGPINTVVSSPAPATTFTFSNLNFTFDGGIKTATVTPNPANATYTANLTGGPAVGSYTVTATATGNFTGSGAATLTINPGVANHIPKISWNVYDSGGHLSGSLPPLFVPSGNYHVQASGYSDVGQLVNVIVWKDGVPFAWDGGGDKYSNRTDPNWVGFAGNGTVHLFSAQAVSYNGQTYYYSPVIYWLVKETAANGSFTFNDLVGIRAQNPNKNPNVPNTSLNAWMPNVGDILSNTYILNGVIASLQNDHQAKSLEFSPEIYSFDDRTPLNATQLPGTGGYMSSFVNVGQLLLIGTPGSTVLDWAIRDPNNAEAVMQPGGTRGPATPYENLFNFTHNPIDPYPNDEDQFGQSASGLQPHHFLFFDSNCASIVISGITFWTDYLWRIGLDGSHIKLNGNNHRITNCEFHNGPGFSVSIGAGGTAQYVNVDSSRFYYTFADGLHAGALSNPGGLSYFTGNSFYETGDDAISVSSLTNGLVVQNSTIVNTHKRGIYLGEGEQNVTLQYNVVSSTASVGIQVGGEGGTGPSQNISSISNYVENLGVLTDSANNAPTNWAHGYWFNNVQNLLADFAPLNSAAYPHSNYASYRVNGTTGGQASGAFLTNVSNAQSGQIKNYLTGFDNTQADGKYVKGAGCSATIPAGP